MAQKSVTHVALEASSHGLHQERLAGLKISAAGFTNLTQDHLDYHGTMTAYLQAKSLLFDRILPSSGTAILNQDQSCFPGLQEISRQRCQALLTYSTKGDRGADLRVVGRQSQDLTQPVSLEILGKPYKVPFPLRGGFQLENALCALGLVLATGGHEEKAVAGLAGLTGEAGRLEFIGTTLTGGAVFVDFAHTPDSLQRVLEALRPITWGKLWIVFGCGGNRDSSKRGLMGQAAAEGADEVIVTDDNPRFEDPAEIRRQTRQGCPNAMEIGDRAQAIETAISQLGPGDSLVIAGKGHERGQMIGSTLLPFQDSEVARQILGRLKRDR
jgi:UDP-N-acetylmuramoyl-L-alanyl-D-glutamate--2,6-diaminopimelate ligase